MLNLLGNEAGQLNTVHLDRDVSSAGRIIQLSLISKEQDSSRMQRGNALYFYIQH
jgi:hypothetical protein